MINLAAATTKRTESFVSYVDCEAQTSSNRTDNSDERKLCENFVFLPGEEEIAAACSRVIAYRPCTQNRQGILGFLRCTNFRLIFTPFLETEDNSKTLNLKMLGDSRYQTPLLNIFALFYTSTCDQKRFKPLQECLTHSDQVSMVKILCKDFRVFLFDFKMLTDQYKTILNALLLKPHFKTLDGILATTSEIMGYNFHTLQYNYCWEVELNRLNVNPNSFRITGLNLNVKRIKSYPQNFVVPYTWEDSTILKHMHVWNECRIPVWCFSLKNCSALLRSARLATGSEIAERCVQHFEYTLQQTQNSFEKEVRFTKLSYLNAKDISQSYECLRKLCSIDSIDDFWTLDVRWNTELEKTNWLLLVSKCLQYTNKVIKLMSEENSCVVLEETNNDDAACIISSLVQLCLDANFRTIDGFMDLLQKEWSVLGHKFEEKLYGTNNAEMTPSLLLFLDCVQQLIDQNPAHFQFSQYFLIGLWDLALSGLHPLFLGGVYKNPNFEDFFRKEILELFQNPSYNDDSNYQNLHIKFTIPNLNFWIDNFQRYLAPCQILRGGGIQAYMEHRNLVTVIQHDRDPQVLTFEQNLSRNITSAYPYCNETPPPVPELLYALPAIKLRSQMASKSSPRSQLELSPKTSAIDVRRLSLAASTKQYATRPASFYLPREPDRPRAARFTAAANARGNWSRPTLNTGVVDDQGRKVRDHVMLNDDEANVVIVKLDTLV